MNRLRPISNINILVQFPHLTWCLTHPVITQKSQHYNHTSTSAGGSKRKVLLNLSLYKYKRWTSIGFVFLNLFTYSNVSWELFLFFYTLLLFYSLLSFILFSRCCEPKYKQAKDTFGCFLDPSMIYLRLVFTSIARWRLSSRSGVYTGKSGLVLRLVPIPGIDRFSFHCTVLWLRRRLPTA